MTSRIEKLVFVYAADSGLFNALTDYAHKILSPKTYECSLCALTYGPLGMNRAWANFVRDLGTAVEFLHRDELVQKYGAFETELPAVFRLDGNALRPWISAPEIRSCTTLDELMILVRKHIAS